MRESYRNDLNRLRALGSKPQSVRDLLEWNGEEGTHSIIDIERVTYNPEEIDLGVASPLDEDLIELFGTRQPSYEMVGQHQDEL